MKDFPFLKGELPPPQHTRQSRAVPHAVALLRFGPRIQAWHIGEQTRNSRRSLERGDGGKFPILDLQ